MEEQNEVEAALQEMAADVATAAKEALIIRNEAMPTLVFLTTPAGLATTAIVDVAAHVDAIKEAIDLTAANGFVLVHDGLVNFGDGLPSVKAVLVLTVSKWGLAEGFAYPYQSSPFGARFGTTLSAPPHVTAPYVKLFP